MEEEEGGRGEMDLDLVGMKEWDFFLGITVCLGMDTGIMEDNDSLYSI